MADSPAAPRTPTRAWARACSGSSRWCRTRTRSARKNARNPTPTRNATWSASPTASIDSGRTSNRATATTMPPVSAISVCRSRWSLSATKPPASVETTVSPASGIAIQVNDSSGRCRRSRARASAARTRSGARTRRRSASGHSSVSSTAPQSRQTRWWWCSGPQWTYAATWSPASGRTDPLWRRRSTVRYAVASPRWGDCFRARSKTSATVKLPLQPAMASSTAHRCGVRRVPSGTRSDPNSVSTPASLAENDSHSQAQASRRRRSTILIMRPLARRLMLLAACAGSCSRPVPRDPEQARPRRGRSRTGWGPR